MNSQILSGDGKIAKEGVIFSKKRVHIPSEYASELEKTEYFVKWDEPQKGLKNLSLPLHPYNDYFRSDLYEGMIVKFEPVYYCDIHESFDCAKLIMAHGKTAQQLAEELYPDKEYYGMNVPMRVVAAKQREAFTAGHGSWDAEIQNINMNHDLEIIRMQQIGLKLMDEKHTLKAEIGKLVEALRKHHVSMIENGNAFYAGSELYNITEEALKQYQKEEGK